MRRTGLVVLLALAIVATGTADFAAAPGFSGRVADCSSCHRPPVEGDDAQVAITGIPADWLPDTNYDWLVDVTGGPQTIPTGPQAGFEVEVLDGTLSPGPEASGDVRGFHDRQATYTEDGVFQRQWSVTWTSPGLDQYPAPITVWVAGLAANGNHNPLNASAAGEQGDSVATMRYTIPPAAAALDAWRAMPLMPPAIDQVVPRDGGHTIHGRMLDDNATAVEVFDGRQWVQRPAGPSWRLVVQGDEDIRLRASGAERTSPELLIDIASGQVVTEPVADEATPLPALIPILAILIAWRRP